MLEQQNALLRAKLSKMGDTEVAIPKVTKEKLEQAKEMMEKDMITSADFAAIKAKWMQDEFGVAAP